MNFAMASLIFFSSLFFNLNAQNEIVDKLTKVGFPNSVSFEFENKRYELEATGVTTRKKLILKVYSIAHYLQKGVKVSLPEIFSDANAKQFTMKWVHDVSLEKVQNAYQESFQRVFSPERSQALGKEINQFLSFFKQSASKGDEYIIRWIPGGYIQVTINGKIVGTIKNPEFAVGIWNIWFGPKSIVDPENLLDLT